MLIYPIAVSACLLFGEIANPRCHDDRLVFELFAAEPNIVTPIGITVDDRGNPLVIESHTHFPPQGYDGPKHDRIRRLEDTDGDGKADRVTTFWEGSSKTMGIGRHPTNGWTYVATRDTVFRLKDSDGNGAADRNEPLVSLKSNDAYPHSGISGFAFAPNGDVFFGFGENHAEPFTMTCADGTRLTGMEGGHVYRIDEHGNHLHRIAIGCWNPFHLAFDLEGRLFAVDNDPDSLPPCRLLHIVAGGDYGYKYRNGRKGTHPFTAWNGELPGTLPMAAGTGEAPSGIYACGAADTLPADFAGDLLVTSWGDHRIERYRLRQQGASVRAERLDLVSGGENFRPVGICAGGDGAIYITDWVDKSYELHKKGRIWRLRPTREATDTTAEKHGLKIGAAELQVKRLNDDATKSTAELWNAAESTDPFIATAARNALARRKTVVADWDTQKHPPQRRTAMALLLREQYRTTGHPLLPELLRDPEPDVRLIALQWIGEDRIKSFRKDLDRVLTSGPVTQRLFAAWLAAVEKLDSPPRKDSDEWAMDKYLAAALVNDTLPTPVRRWALRALRPDDFAITSARMREWLASDDPLFRLEAVRTLRESDLRDRTELLRAIANDSSNDATLRAEAVMGLPAFNAADIRKLVDIAVTDSPTVSHEAVRSLRGVGVSEEDRQRLHVLRQRSAADADLVDRVLNAGPVEGLPTPTDIDKWLKLLEGPADPTAGERIFFHAKIASCSRCHQREGRGGIVGPDLSVIGRSMDRRRLIESILQPSREVAPQFVVWTVETDDGQVRSGVFLGTRPNGDEIYYPEKGGTFAVRPGEITNKVASRTSVMPEGIASQMTLQELRDLLAYLRQ